MMGSTPRLKMVTLDLKDNLIPVSSETVNQLSDLVIHQVCFVPQQDDLVPIVLAQLPGDLETARSHPDSQDYDDSDRSIEKKWN